MATVSAIEPSFLDANSGAICPPAVIDAMVRWINRGDPTAEHGPAQESRAMLAAFAQEIAEECGFELTSDAPNSYSIVFTSGAAESNAAIVTGTARSFAALTGKMPHIITSDADHPSLVQCCRRLAEEKYCHLTVLLSAAEGPARGRVTAEQVGEALRPNTCLISIVAANGDTGVVNDLAEIAKVARAAHVPFHTDAAQMFGKLSFRPRKLGVDAFSISFRKLQGPPGVGALVMRRQLVEGYNLSAQIFREGFENIPALGASFTAFRIAMKDRKAKNANLRRLRAALRTTLESRLTCFDVDEHPGDAKPSMDGGITVPPPSRKGTPAALAAIQKAKPVIFWVTPEVRIKSSGELVDELDPVLPNTLLFAVRMPQFSSRLALGALERRGAVVGRVAGTRCAPTALSAALLRVSFSDYSSINDVKKFLIALLDALKGTECLTDDRPVKSVGLAPYAPPPTTRVVSYVAPVPRREKREKRDQREASQGEKGAGVSVPESSRPARPSPDPPAPSRVPPEKVRFDHPKPRTASRTQGRHRRRQE